MATSGVKRRLFIVGVLIAGMTGFALTCVLLHLNFFWGMAAVLPGMTIAILEDEASQGSSSAGIALRSVWSIALVAVVLIWLPMIIMVIGNSLFKYTPGHRLNWIAVLVWPVGWAAFRFKQYNSAYYGAVEIAVGVVTAFATTVKGQFGPTQGLAVLGAMYIVSRGYSNIADAEKRKDEIERNAQAFRDYRSRVKIAGSKLWATIRNKDVRPNG